MMRKVLRSGNVFMGACGKETHLTDSSGNGLCVGDLVIVFSEKAEKRDGYLQEAWGLEYVVEDDSGMPFIMGLKSSMRQVREYYLDGEKASENDYDYCETCYVYDQLPEGAEGHKWFVQLAKGHEKTVPGECWGSGNVTVHLEDDQPEAAREEVFF